MDKNFDNCLTECDVLATSTLVANQIAACVHDQDTLDLLAEIVTAIGESLALLAGQRARRQNCKKHIEKQTSTDNNPPAEENLLCE